MSDLIGLYLGLTYGSDEELVVSPVPEFTNLFALDFNGVDEYTASTNQNPTGGDSTPFTISWWQKGEQAKHGYMSLSRPTGVFGSGFVSIFSRDNGANLICQMRDRSGNQIRVANITNPSASSFTHYAMVYNGSDTVDVYVDGVLNASDTEAAFTGEYTPDVDPVWAMGRSLAKNYGQCALDEVAIWADQALAVDQISDIYFTGLARNLNNIVDLDNPDHWWRMGDLAYPASVPDVNGGVDTTPINMDLSNLTSGVPTT